MAPPLIYLASPVGTYSTPRYARMAGLAVVRFPGHMLLPGRGLYADSGEWLDRWPEILPSLTGLVFFADEDGWIGRGVWRELHDTTSAGLPVWFLDDAGALTPLAELGLNEPDDPDDWTQYARVPAVRRE